MAEAAPQASPSKQGSCSSGGGVGGKELCMLAKRVPKMSPGLSGDQKQVEEEQRQALVGVIKFLHDNPDHSVACFMALNSWQIKTSKIEEANWLRQYCTLKNIPKYAKSQILMHCEPNLTKPRLNAMDSEDPDAILFLFNNAVQLTDGQLLVDVMRNNENSI